MQELWEKAIKDYQRGRPGQERPGRSFNLAFVKNGVEQIKRLRGRAPAKDAADEATRRENITRRWRSWKICSSKPSRRNNLKTTPKTEGHRCDYESQSALAAVIGESSGERAGAARG